MKERKLWREWWKNTLFIALVRAKSRLAQYFRLAHFSRVKKFTFGAFRHFLWFPVRLAQEFRLAQPKVLRSTQKLTRTRFGEKNEKVLSLSEGNSLSEIHFSAYELFYVFARNWSYGCPIDEPFEALES